MNREDAKKHIKSQLETYLQGKGIDTKKPFHCVNPDHEDKNPSMRYDRKREKCHCFSCGADYDTLDLVSIEYGVTGQALFLKAYDLFGLSVEGDGARIAPSHKPNGKKDTQLIIHNTVNTIDYTQYFTQCREAIDRTDYPQRRGLTAPTLRRFSLGYDPLYHKGTGAGTWQALIIPTSKSTFVARNTAPDAGKKDRYRKQGGSLCFNLQALADADKPVFIVEGELDALSIAEVGGEAVSLGSTSNTGQLLRHIEHNRPSKPLILALDNDAEGEKASQVLMEAFAQQKITFYQMNIAEGYKDANEALLADREAFAAMVRGAEGIEAATLEAEKERYQRTSAAFQLQGFVEDIEKSKRSAYISTGFEALDAILDGGLYAGLYVIGAISSLGKTTFCLQVADQIAQTGQDVLIFSLEMARNELIGKSISRHTMIEERRKGRTTVLAKTTRGILTGTRYSAYTQQERQIIAGALDAYSAYAGHVFFHIGMGDIGVEKVREVSERHMKITGNKPVVLIDYVQILAPYNERATDKQNTDKAVLELKRMSRDFDLPVLCISSFNRDNYNAPVNLASFKESGAIEYTSDVLIGLQYDGMDYADGEKEPDRNKRIRSLMKAVVEDGKNGKAQRVQVKILKNRNGSKGDLLLDFYPMFNCFVPPENAPDTWVEVKDAWHPFA